MNAKELMIGNKVIHNGKVHDIVSIDIYNDIKADPIPLNEEWLLKLGFRHAYTSVHEGISIYNKDLFSIEYHQDTLWINGNKVNHIKHVHQLQNLYFCLTGKELEIK